MVKSKDGVGTSETLAPEGRRNNQMSSSKNYFLFTTVIAFALIGIILCIPSFLREYKIIKELRVYGKYATGIFYLSDDPEQLPVVCFSEEGSEYYVEVINDKFQNNEALPIIYSVRNPEIVRIYSYGEYTLPIVLNGFLCLFFIVGLALALACRDWLLNQEGTHWPYG